MNFFARCGKIGSVKQLGLDIKNKEFHRVYLFYGKEVYLKEQYRTLLVKSAVDPSDTMNYACFSGKDIPAEELVELAGTLPLFAERRLILVRDSGFFKNAVEDMLVDYVRNPSPDTLLLFDEEEVDKRSRMYKAVKETGYVAEFTGLDEKSLKHWIAKRFSSGGKKILESTTDYLTERCGSDMETLYQEIEKLISYTGDREEVTKEDIRAISVVQVTDSVFEMLDAIIAHDRITAMRRYDELLFLKEPPMKILILLGRQFSMLRRAKKMKAEGQSKSAVASALSVPPGIAGKYLSRAEKLSFSDLRGAIELCERTEADIKGGLISDRLGVELVIVRYADERNERRGERRK